MGFTTLMTRRDRMRLFLLSLVASVAVIPASAVAISRPNPTELSFQYVPRGQLYDREVRIIDTPYGRIRCIGGNRLPYLGIGQATGTRARACKYINVRRNRWSCLPW
jgi:hypothetical protein